MNAATNIVTETRAGLTTFMVMCYIIIPERQHHRQAARPRPDRRCRWNLPLRGRVDYRHGRCVELPVRPCRGPRHQRHLVAYQLAAPKANGGLGMTPGAAMGVIVARGRDHHGSGLVLVLREAIMRAVPLALKRSIGVGIGLFILFIGLSNGGLIARLELRLRLGSPGGPSTDR